MAMHRLSFDTVKSELYEEVTSYGLKVVVCPIKGTTKVYAGIHVETGAYRHETMIDKVKMPQGVAHFLEHMLFYTPKGSAHKLFADLNASANAYTSESSTVFYFSTTEDYQKPLDLLLTMVTNVGFKEEDVENEKKVILNELDEDKSNPLSLADAAIRKNLYSYSPLKDNILGEEEEIKTIHLSTLKKYFTEKYRLNKMTLFITGNIKPEDVHNFLDSRKFTNVINPPTLEVKPYENKEEYGQVNELESEINAAYSTEMLTVGIKFMPRLELFKSFEEDLFAIYEILEDLLFGDNNAFLEKLRDDGLITSMVSSSLDEGGEDAFYSATFLTPSPEELKNRLQSYFLNLKQNISNSAFELILKSYFGNAIRIIGSASSVFFCLLSAYENHNAYPALVERVYRLSYKKVKRFLKNMQNWCISFVVVHKKGEQE